MPLEINTRKKGLLWRIFHKCDFSKVEHVHYWDHVCRADGGVDRWYLFSYEVKRCILCGCVKEHKYNDVTLPIGGRDVCYRIIK